MVMAAILPALLRGARGAARGFGPSIGMGLAGIDGSGIGRDRRRRRRRRRLTQQDLAELSMIKMTLGKTAAANALPYYLGRR